MEKGVLCEEEHMIGKKLGKRHVRDTTFKWDDGKKSKDWQFMRLVRSLISRSL